MKADGACRVDLELISAPQISGLLPENNLRRRRTADISHTDKQDSKRLIIRTHTHLIGRNPPVGNAIEIRNSSFNRIGSVEWNALAPSD
jgi:hypothetical protein